MTGVQPATASLVSIGDEGALNSELKGSLSEIWIDRDISWLDFNERVLAEALDAENPLLERVKFLAIFTSNLDEFFMKRMATLRESPGSTNLRHQLRHKIVHMLEAESRCFHAELVPALARQNVLLKTWQELTAAQREEANEYFDNQISAAVTPLVIRAGESFPFLSNLSNSVVFRMEDGESGETFWARVKIPPNLRQWTRLTRDVPLEAFLFVRLQDIIRTNLSKLYPGMKIGVTSLMRVTRDAVVAEENVPYEGTLEHVRQQVKKRRFEPVVRLEFTPNTDQELIETVRQQFRLDPDDVFAVSGDLDYTSLFELTGLPTEGLTEGLKDTPWQPVVPAALRAKPGDIFSVIGSGDLLVHHPYESFDASVEHFIKKAADDPQVVSLKMTVYRVGDDTPFVRSLIRAAEAGKQVACVIELNARFDEDRNLHWAAALEKAGAHVSFGVKGLKIHGKTALVVRNESEGLRSYAHIGTGNYHVRTARLYADVGLLTCDPRLTQDVVSLFHYLTGHSHAPEYKSLLVAPHTMRSHFLELIRREAANKQSGQYARIIAKMNQLEDPEIIEALCEASCAGVPIDLIIRGFCCLKPGVPGLTENIKVRSILGRFLEHSRIYYFANTSTTLADGDFYIGSADWMFRNLSRRVEVITPVFAPEPRRRLAEILGIYLHDDRQSWILGPDAHYLRTNHENVQAQLGSHRQLMELAANS